ncbi:MAG: alkyl sulfatase dimerization domain-containing protein [Myxococcota bacterium]
MPSLRKISEELWTGVLSTAQPDHHPFAAYDTTEEVADGVAFYKDFVNVTGVRTGEGLALIDTGSYHPIQHTRSHRGIRGLITEPLHTAIYTHGHVDHAYGLPPYLAELAEAGRPRPRVVGHEGIAPRMERYVETQGYNSIINSRQFGIPIQWPTEFVRPTICYRESLDLRVGDTEIRLFHTRGETDDHTWAWLPATRVLCTGDLFIWSCPNAGNPQKVQRYAADWAQGLRRMAALDPEVLLPGHGVPIFGAARVREALSNTATYLESLYQQTLSLMNQGARIYEIVQQVEPPSELAELPYLRPVYDEPEFIVRNIVRHLGGWYSGVPSELQPAPRVEQAREIVALAGGLERLVERARVCAESGDLALASHLVDWACDAAPDSGEVHALRAQIYSRRAEAATSTMARGVYSGAARESGQGAQSSDS